MTKKNIMPVVILTAICMVVALILGAVNLLTGPIIQKMEDNKVYESLKEALDGDPKPINPLPEGVPNTVTSMCEMYDGDTLLGHVVTLVVKGYAGDISLTVGVDSDNRITKVLVTNQSETHGKSGMKEYPNSFEGIHASEVAEVETFTGATVSSTAIKKAVIDAVNAVTGGSISLPDDEGGDESVGAVPEVLPRTDAELVTLAGELVPGAKTLEDVTPEKNASETLKRLYKAEGVGYVAYILTRGWGNSIANEGLVYIDLNGNVAAINHLTWNVGHGVSADGYAENFVGKDNWSVGDVDIITGATGTSADFRSAVSDAVYTVTKMIPRSDEKLLELVDKTVPMSSDFELVELPEDAPETLRRLYKETLGRGYVAYIGTTGWGGSIATEALVYFDTEGTIQNVNLLIWNVGHGVEAGNFPKSFIGKNADTVEEVELITSATGTSSDLKAAIVAAFPYIPTHFPIARALGIAIICAAIAATVIFVITKKKRRAVK